MLYHKRVVCCCTSGAGIHFVGPFLLHLFSSSTELTSASPLAVLKVYLPSWRSTASASLEINLLFRASLLQLLHSPIIQTLPAGLFRDFYSNALRRLKNWDESTEHVAQSKNRLIKFRHRWWLFQVAYSVRRMRSYFQAFWSSSWTSMVGKTCTKSHTLWVS